MALKIGRIKTQYWDTFLSLVCCIEFIRSCWSQFWDLGASRVRSYVNSLGERCNTVLLWSSGNVFFLLFFFVFFGADNDWIFIFEWRHPLRVCSIETETKNHLLFSTVNFILHIKSIVSFLWAIFVFLYTELISRFWKCAFNLIFLFLFFLPNNRILPRSTFKNVRLHISHSQGNYTKLWDLYILVTNQERITKHTQIKSQFPFIQILKKARICTMKVLPLV